MLLLDLNLIFFVIMLWLFFFLRLIMVVELINFFFFKVWEFIFMFKGDFVLRGDFFKFLVDICCFRNLLGDFGDFRFVVGLEFLFFE